MGNVCDFYFFSIIKQAQAAEAALCGAAACRSDATNEMEYIYIVNGGMSKIGYVQWNFKRAHIAQMLYSL